MTRLHAIHGFLGLPSDWNVFKIPSLIAHDLTSPALSPSSDGFWGWAKRFNALSNSTEKKILLGYSLGGRLAIHALLDQPTQWLGGIIVSSNPGLKNSDEKSIRLQQDVRWAERFEKESWSSVLKAWNQQSVFAGISSPLPRHENQFDRQHLAQLLKVFSLGHQEDLTTSLSKLPIPILWIYGKFDTKFQNLSKNLSFSHPKSRVEFIEGAAHRVPWEQPIAFINLIQSFIQEVLK